ncbi:recombinase RecT [Pleomorphovibrio marinus]|uniref:recombinase RecT n=1 Tax=Pleomorphovibrio marinus TaxID=2164132 RepID=UPI000E0A2F32|nr:recombinase RecT [Pleomorphovibrio marinus]
MQVQKSKEFIQDVTNRVTSLQESGEIKFPANYSPQNALSSAWMSISELTDKNGKPVSESCTKVSIANALMKMVVQGLSPVKNQCYFIAYGDKLTFQRSYQGTIAVAKRVGDVKQVNANVIYKGDEYTTEIDQTGVRKLVRHDSPFDNRDDNNIRGAYAVVVFNDGSTKLEEMTILEIKKAWAQGATKGNSPAHTNFSGEMAKKTVINRALKTIVNSSADTDLFEEDDTTQTEAPKIPKEANKQSLSFDDYEEVKEPQKGVDKGPEPVKQEPKKEAVKERELAFEGEGKGNDPF